jgi:hypothetical protein
MFKHGDIVFKQYTGNGGGIVDYSKVGLILEVHHQPSSMSQYRVSFGGYPPAWYEERYLYKIKEPET